MCCCDGKRLNSVSPTFLSKGDQDLRLSSLGVRRIFKMELETRRKEKRCKSRKKEYGVEFAFVCNKN